MKRITVLFSFIVLVHIAGAQDIYFTGRANIGVGFHEYDLNFHGSKVPYSLGGGSGIEAGIQTKVQDRLYFYALIGFHQVYTALMASDGLNNKYESSISFGRFTGTVGGNFFLKISENVFNGFLIGGGGTYNLPGKIKIVENEIDMGHITYDAAPGYFGELKIRLKISDSFFIEPGIRARSLHFTSNFYSEGSTARLPDHLERVNASGLDFSTAVTLKI